jgi:hypothetical protein
MKRALILLLFAISVSVSVAGGPQFEARDAVVESIEHRPGGLIITLSGVGGLFVGKPPDEVDQTGNAKLVRLKMSRTQIIYTGDELHNVGKTADWEKRLKSIVGTRVPTIQAWGISATVEGGELVRVFARHVHPFVPTPEEATFRYDKLDTLRNK